MGIKIDSEIETKFEKNEKGMQKVRRTIYAETRPCQIDQSISLSPFLVVPGGGVVA